MNHTGHAIGIGQMVLGTAQLGLPDYGIANTHGRPDESTSSQILREAVSLGIGAIDTARGYGDAESRIGIALGATPIKATIVTKLSPDDVSELSSADAEKLTEQSIEESLAALRLSRLPVLLLHRWAQRHACGGAVWQRLRKLQAQGIIGRLGVSVLGPAEALEALADPEVQHLQIPFNLFDWRWKRMGVIDQIIGRPDVSVHTRSTFLQGLMFLPAERWPGGPTEIARKAVERLAKAVAEFSRESIADLALAAVRGMPWIVGVIAGLETIEQLHANARLFQRPPLEPALAHELTTRFQDIPVEILDPSRWATLA